jgi:hypothetical protein
MTIYFIKLTNPTAVFSNFSAHPQIQLDDGLDWQTVEHYYQAQKFVTPRLNLISVIRAVKTPLVEAAAIGRDRTYKLRPDWESVKNSNYGKAVLTKFYPCRYSRNFR